MHEPQDDQKRRKMEHHSEHNRQVSDRPVMMSHEHGEARMPIQSVLSLNGSSGSVPVKPKTVMKSAEVQVSPERLENEEEKENKRGKKKKRKRRQKASMEGFMPQSMSNPYQSLFN
jgi:hypothetical protein